ncbi:MAG TPA: stage V sporulation protein AB [Bacillota bacterium]|nr:stage V sporulation protein AB [Bacillota bacterium]
MTVLIPVIGLAEGLAVGAAFVAVLTLLRVVPRLRQLCGGSPLAYGVALALGAVVGALDEAVPLSLKAGPAPVPVAGLLAGIFIGMVAAGIAEAAAILPLAGRRLGISRWLLWLVVALVIGKAAGATLWWAVPSLHAR